MFSDAQKLDFNYIRNVIQVIFHVSGLCEIEEKGGIVFIGCQLWSIPENDIEVVHSAWNELKSIVRKGVRLEKRGHRVTNNLPGNTHHRVFHVRNHSNNILCFWRWLKLEK